MTKTEQRLLAAKIDTEKLEWAALAERAERAGMRTEEIRGIRYAMGLAAVCEWELDRISNLRAIASLTVDAHEQQRRRDTADATTTRSREGLGCEP